jgi:predicted N-formylglutamate amidohydrolase
LSVRQLSTNSVTQVAWKTVAVIGLDDRNREATARLMTVTRPLHALLAHTLRRRWHPATDRPINVGVYVFSTESSLIKVSRPFGIGVGRTIADFDELIAMIRQNINELVEQAAAYSGAENEERAANRIAEQERKLAKLIELRDALTRS